MIRRLLALALPPIEVVSLERDMVRVTVRGSAFVVTRHDGRWFYCDADPCDPAPVIGRVLRAIERVHTERYGELPRATIRRRNVTP